MPGLNGALAHCKTYRNLWECQATSILNAYILGMLRFTDSHRCTGINVQDATGWKSAHRLQFGLNLQCIDCSVFASVKKRFIHIIPSHPVSTQQRRSLIFASHYGGRESQLSTHMEVEEKEKHSAPTNTYKSNVWQHFAFFKKDGQLEKSLANCNQCRAALKYTSRLVRRGVCVWKETYEDIWVKSLSEVFCQWEWCLVYSRLWLPIIVYMSSLQL